MRKLLSKATKKKILLVTASIIVIIAATGTYFYFNVKPSQTNTQLTVANATMVKEPTNESLDGVKVFQTDINIDTKEQGDCTLTLSNSDNSYTFTNTTKGIEGRTGCLDWNIGSNNIMPGTYEMVLNFVSETSTSTLRKSVILE